MRSKILVGLIVFVVSSGLGIARASDAPADAPKNDKEIEVECQFVGAKGKDKGNGTCVARAVICGDHHAWSDKNDRHCDSDLTLVCDGVSVYANGLAIAFDRGTVILQGITSLQNPTPPSIFIEKRGSRFNNALLNLSTGQFTGSCRVDEDIE